MILVLSIKEDVDDFLDKTSVVGTVRIEFEGVFVVIKLVVINSLGLVLISLVIINVWDGGVSTIFVVLVIMIAGVVIEKSFVILIVVVLNVSIVVYVDTLSSDDVEITVTGVVCNVKMEFEGVFVVITLVAINSLGLVLISLLVASASDTVVKVLAWILLEECMVLWSIILVDNSDVVSMLKVVVDTSDIIFSIEVDRIAVNPKLGFVDSIAVVLLYEVVGKWIIVDSTMVNVSVFLVDSLIVIVLSALFDETPKFVDSISGSRLDKDADVVEIAEIKNLKS